jgi:3-oxoacyl-[acyl-carrier protein] reductase
MQQNGHYPGLAGKVAVVTGASGSIGGEVARALARHGVAVAVTGRNEEKLNQVARDIVDSCGKAIAVTADVTKAHDVERLCQEVEGRLGEVDLVAAVAGGGVKPATLLKLTLESWRETVGLNLTSAFLIMKTFLPGMVDRKRGSIVTIASIAGHFIVPPGVSSPAYGAAKAGLLMLTRQAASEVAASGVRINAVSPGAVYNDNLRRQPAEVQEAIAGMHPLGRIGDPRDVAEAVLYLLSDSSSWVTGTTLTIAGGMVTS